MLRTKSYNLVETVLVSRGMISIHFNGEVVRFLVTEGSDEYQQMVAILSSKVSVRNVQADAVSTPEKKEKRVPSISWSKTKEKKSPESRRDTKRMIAVIATVILLSFAGTMGMIYGQRFFAGLNDNPGLTAEKVKQIEGEIAGAEDRIFMIEEYVRMLNNYTGQLDLISSSIAKISPSNVMFDWAGSSNAINGYKLTMHSLQPVAMNDEGPYFSFGKGRLYETEQEIHGDIVRLLDAALEGIETRFSSISDLVKLTQTVNTIKEDVLALNDSAAQEIQDLQSYIDGKKALIAK